MAHQNVNHSHISLTDPCIQHDSQSMSQLRFLSVCVCVCVCVCVFVPHTVAAYLTNRYESKEDHFSPRLNTGKTYQHYTLVHPAAVETLRKEGHYQTLDCHDAPHKPGFAVCRHKPATLTLIHLNISFQGPFLQHVTVQEHVRLSYCALDASVSAFYYRMLL